MKIEHKKIFRGPSIYAIDEQTGVTLKTTKDDLAHEMKMRLSIQNYHH